MSTPKRARVFQSGNSQAVRLPKAFRFQTQEVEVFRRGDEVVLREPKKDLAAAFDVLAGMPRDFMRGGRRDRRPQKRKGL